MSFSKSMSKWKSLAISLLERQCKPLFEPVFVLYFLIFIVGIGATGVWLEYVEYRELGGSPNVSTKALLYSLATYSIALSSAALAELFLSKPGHEEEESVDKDVRFAHLCLGLLAVVGSLVTFLDQSNWSIRIQALATALSLILWWQVNYNNPNLNAPKVDPGNAKGSTDIGDASEDDGGYQLGN